MIKSRHDSAAETCVMPQLSGVDGYIRMHQRDLYRVELIHVCTLRDAELLGAVAHGAQSAGLTEWIGKLNGSSTGISMGWDWYRDAQNLIRLANSEIRSNLMLVGLSGSDWGMHRTEHALRRWIGRFNWAETIAKCANEFLH